MGQKDLPHSVQHRFLDITAEQALFGPVPEEDRLTGLIATFHPGERPLQGLAGLLDWRFRGCLSSYIRAGAVTGEKGETTYIPVLLPYSPQGRTYRIFLVGAGKSSLPGQREPIDENIARSICKAVDSLKIQRIGVSRSDLGGVSKDFFSKNMKGVPLWVTQ